ncbi:exosome-associated family protein [Rutstroemia sp. NJR-2017a WRK4]|nr:exosome-associated family protein [Rutstroemia sp. NJR-2017a WRK4]
MKLQRLNGINAREHAVFTELTRVKQYFQKIDAAENPVAEKSNLKLDKGAAGRFIKAGLSGNDKYDLQRAEREAKERARSHIKFAELSKKRKVDEEATIPNVQKTESSEHSDDSSSGSDSPAPISKKRKTGEVSQEVQTNSPDEAVEQPKSKSRSKKPKQEGKEKKNQKSKKKKKN